MGDLIADIRSAIGPAISDRPALRGNFVYLIRWPDGVLKVGYASTRARWRTHVCRGGELVHLAAFESCSAALAAESAAERHMNIHLRRAFNSRSSARTHLSGGSGWTECYRIEGGH